MSKSIKVCKEEGETYKTETGITKHNNEEHGGKDNSSSVKIKDQGTMHVSSYTKKDGTEVSGYERSKNNN